MIQTIPNRLRFVARAIVKCIRQMTRPANGSAAGNLIIEIDPSGHVTSFAYDGSGNLISRTDPSGDTTTFGYDREGNLISETGPDGNTIAHRVDRTGSGLPDLVTRQLPDRLRVSPGQWRCEPMYRRRRDRDCHRVGAR